MAEEATFFYFTHYRQHWCSKHLADAFACIPQVMMWDDHDIFDGWGSYPHALLTCSVFQGTSSPHPWSLSSTASESSVRQTVTTIPLAGAATLMPCSHALCSKVSLASPAVTFHCKPQSLDTESPNG